MLFCALIVNMIFIWNKHVSESKKNEKPWFFRTPPVWSRNICANCDDRGHIGEHSGKV